MRASILSFLLFGILSVSCDFLESSIMDNPTSMTISLQYKGPVFQGNYYSGYLPKTDYAIWITDANNQFIRTLQVNKGAVKIGKYGAHAWHLPTWLSHTNDSIKDIPDVDSIPPRFDGITAASHAFDAIEPTTTTSAIWDFKDASGKLVADGIYNYHVEAANIKKDSTGTIINGVDYELSVNPDHVSGSVTYPAGVVINGNTTVNILSFSGVLN